MHSQHSHATYKSPSQKSLNRIPTLNNFLEIVLSACNLGAMGVHPRPSFADLQNQTNYGAEILVSRRGEACYATEANLETLRGPRMLTKTTKTHGLALYWHWLHVCRKAFSQAGSADPFPFFVMSVRPFVKSCRSSTSFHTGFSAPSPRPAFYHSPCPSLASVCPVAKSPSTSLLGLDSQDGNRVH